jgi:manganese transport protein
LVFSQVLLSLQLGFAIIPLIHFVSDKKTMGIHAIKPTVKILSWLVAAVVVYLNIRMAYGVIFADMTTVYSLWGELLLGILALGLIILLAYVLFYPFFSKREIIQSSRIHPERASLPDLSNIIKPVYRKIAMALDFSKNDGPIIASALAQGQEDTEYLLIHITESASSRLMGGESNDYETQQDREQLQTYVRLLKEKNIPSEAILGHSRRAKEIVRIVNEHEADLLILGGHGHTGLKDWIYGETVNYVRHYVNIPVLIINNRHR